MRKLIPQVRFPEFSGEWEEKKLGEISTFLDGRRKPIKSDDRTKMKGDYPYYGASGIIDYVNNYIFDEELILLGEDGENIISRNSPLAFRVSGKCWINNHAHVIVPKVGTDIDFLTHNLEKINYVVYNTGTAQPKLNQEVCRNIPSFFPSLPEQTKIANFLTEVDEKLTGLNQKKTLLEQYKKGVMQQIFDQELRFKDDNGNDFPDWEEKKLGEVIFKVSKKNKESIKYPIYSINNKEGFLPQSEQFDGLDSNDRGYDISMYKIVHHSTFAYNPARINVGSIGYSYNLEVGIVSSLYVCFKTKESLNDLYLLCYLDTYNFKKDILRFEEGGVRQYLFYENFSLIQIPLPSLPEQTKIANFLSAIDVKINHCQEQIDQSKIWKKGLLQQMFV